MGECIHIKVYANYILAVSPPLFPWICQKCGTKGTDSGWKGYNPAITYDELERKFREERGE